jgi:SAM-dependent methyltransferase
MQTNTPAEFDAYDERYSETVNRALAFSGLNVDLFTRAKADYLMDLIDALRPPAGRAEVIDIGCGIANSHSLFAGRFGKLVGVDVSRRCIARASEQNPGNEYRRYDGVHLPYPDASFDAASAVCVFHHVPMEQRVPLANDIRRVLRPSGLFAMFEHNPLNPLTMHVVNNCEFDEDAVLLRKADTESILRRAGFREVKSRFILTVPAQGSVLRIIDRFFGRIPFGAQYYSVGRA